MNRRNFFGNMLAASAGFAILPFATLYTRQWKALPGKRSLFIKQYFYANADFYGNAHYELSYLFMGDDGKIVHLPEKIGLDLFYREIPLGTPVPCNKWIDLPIKKV